MLFFHFFLLSELSARDGVWCTLAPVTTKPMEQCVENATHWLYDVTVKGKNGRNTKNISNLQFPKTFVGFGSLKNDSVL